MGEGREGVAGRQTALTQCPAGNRESACPAEGCTFPATSRLLLCSLSAPTASREPDGGRKYKVTLTETSG